MKITVAFVATAVAANSMLTQAAPVPAESTKRHLSQAQHGQHTLKQRDETQLDVRTSLRALMDGFGDTASIVAQSSKSSDEDLKSIQNASTGQSSGTGAKKHLYDEFYYGPKLTDGAKTVLDEHLALHEHSDEQKRLKRLLEDKISTLQHGKGAPGLGSAALNDAKMALDRLSELNNLPMKDQHDLRFASAAELRAKEERKRNRPPDLLYTTAAGRALARQYTTYWPDHIPKDLD